MNWGVGDSWAAFKEIFTPHCNLVAISEVSLGIQWFSWMQRVGAYFLLNWRGGISLGAFLDFYEPMCDNAFRQLLADRLLYIFLFINLGSLLLSAWQRTINAKCYLFYRVLFLFREYLLLLYLSILKLNLPGNQNLLFDFQIDTLFPFL